MLELIVESYLKSWEPGGAVTGTGLLEWLSEQPILIEIGRHDTQYDGLHPAGDPGRLGQPGLGNSLGKPPLSGATPAAAG
ncbi:hypothetical protein GCM10011348_47000 [Marinobacterium nitratireducens]|uniref:Uncharacterized protein n=1 Tax=Marinobacterium nitratireducens TaxID=518897 RepID=A0A917ZRR4_9GAMM|nr:hypothetical protein GCM10011348_47000 [Marinobacterium nitratireducens]